MKQQQLLQQPASEPPKLRPYQENGIDTLRTLISEGVLRILLCIPTGGGKTVVAAHLILMARRLGMRVLFVAHRIELINQTVRQLAKLGIVDVGVIRANDVRMDPTAQVQVASVDTAKNRNIGVYDIVIIDEAHRSVAPNYDFFFSEVFAESLILGLSATPFRSDNKGLGSRFQRLVQCAYPSQLVADGFILEPRVFGSPILSELSDITYSPSAHDYHNKELGIVMSRTKVVGDIVKEWKSKAEGRRTVVFAVNVEHSKRIVAEFVEAGVSAAHLDGTMNEKERALILARLERKKMGVSRRGLEYQLLKSCKDQMISSVNCTLDILLLILIGHGNGQQLLNR